MSGPFATDDRVSQGVALTTSGANTAEFAFGKPVVVKRAVFVVTTAITANQTITFGVRNRNDSSSVTYGTFVVPTGAAINTVLYADVAGVDPDPVVPTGEASQVAGVTMGRVLGYQTNLPGELEVAVSQEFFMTSGGGGAGAVVAYVEYREEGQNLNAATKMVTTL